MMCVLSFEGIIAKREIIIPAAIPCMSFSSANFRIAGDSPGAHFLVYFG